MLVTGRITDEIMALFRIYYESAYNRYVDRGANSCVRSIPYFIMRKIEHSTIHKRRLHVAKAMTNVRKSFSVHTRSYNNDYRDIGVILRKQQKLTTEGPTFQCGGPMERRLDNRHLRFSEYVVWRIDRGNKSSRLLGDINDKKQSSQIYPDQ